jgi:TolB protein
MNENGGDLRQITQATGHDSDPTWSPTGDRLAYAHADFGGSFDIRVIDADGQNTRPLVGGPSTEHFPAWSPDGTRIAYVREDAGPQIAVVPADGATGFIPQVATGTEPSWGPLPVPVAGPDVGQTITIAPVDSRVLVAPATTQQPNASPALQAQLRGASEVPVGTTVDASQGTIAIDAITTTPDGPGTVGHAEVQGGVFTITQTGAAEPTLKMPPGIRPCQKARASRVPPEARMRIKARGRFRTIGGYGRGAARGTEWALRERCDGTIFQVFEGVVLVHDYRRKKSFEVRAGRCYLAATRNRPDAKKPKQQCPPVKGS